MAAKRKKSTKANGRRGSSKSKIDRRWSFLLFALGIVAVVLVFIPGEGWAAWIQSYLLFGVMGISAWLLGPLLIYLGVLIGASKQIKATVFKSLFLMASISGILLIYGSRDFVGIDFFSSVLMALEQGQDTKFGGGLMGLVFGWTLLALCGEILAKVLIILLTIIALMVFTGITPVEITAFLSNKYMWHVENRKINKKMKELEAEFEEVEEIYEEELPPLPQLPPAPKKQFKWFNPLASTGKEKPKPRFTMPKNQPKPMPIKPIAITQNPFVARTEASSAPTFDPLGVGFGKTVIAPPESKALFGEDEPFAEKLEKVVETSKPLEIKNIFAPSKPATPAVAETAVDNETDRLIEKAAVAGDSEEKAGDISPRFGENGSALMPYRYPSMDLFQYVADKNSTVEAKEEMRRTAEKLISTLSSFGVQTTILDVTRGPAVTRYEIKPQEGVKISKITNLADDIALNLAATGVRIEAPIPGKAAVGIEVPNIKKGNVGMRSILETATFRDASAGLPIALGKDIAGTSIVADLSKMPHLLIAGSTGSGKSVCVNATIMSFLYRFSPEELKLILVDPKIVELAEYNDIPHLMVPVVTDPKKASGALAMAATEMDKRYRMFAENGAREFKSFNNMAKSKGLEKMPYIVIIIDELADLMMVAGKEVETHICRIAQKARAAGMHLIVATQRPSVDVITGLIKANIPSRIAFAVSSQIDSRTILDGAGAEKLLGMGDMLYMPVGANKPVRVQGTYVKDEEISAVLSFIKKNGKAQYDEDKINEMERLSSGDSGGGSDTGTDDSLAQDAVFDEAVEIALEMGQISTSFLQRRLRIGYARAGRIVDDMERMRIVSQPEGSKPRQVLVTREQWLDMRMSSPKLN